MNLDETIAELRRLNEPVPRPRRLPTEAEVTALERRLEVRFHPDLRRYLLEASDVVFGRLEPVTAISDGPTDLALVLQDAREYGLPDDLIPVCEDNADFYCMSPQGEIVYWSHNGKTDERWPDLATWIKDVWIQGH